MIVLSDVENYEDLASFQALIKLGDGDPTLSEEPAVRHVEWPIMEDLVDGGKIQTGFEIRWFDLEENAHVGFVEEIEDSTITVCHLETLMLERIPYIHFINPLLLINPYQ